MFLKACNLYQIEYSLKQSKEELQKRSECIDALQNIINAINSLDRDVSAQSNMSELTLSNGVKIGSSKNADTFIYNELNIINNIIISVLNTKTSVYGIGYNGGNDIESISSLFEDVFSRISTLYGNGIRSIIRKMLTFYKALLMLLILLIKVLKIKQLQLITVILLLN